MPSDGFALERALRARIAGEVRFDAGSRALYATDASNYRQTPIGVVLPRSADDLVATIETCSEHGAPVLPRGGGTSLAGQCCNVAVVIDCSKYVNRIVDLDPGTRQARVEPGLVLDELRNAAERHHLTFGPDPATHNHCTLGGMIGNNSCGVHSVMAGKTDDNVLALEVLTYDGVRLRVGATSDTELARISAESGRRGEIYRSLRALRDRYADLIRKRFPRIPRRVSGYNLEELLPENGFNVARALVGSEGTCVTILEAVLRLVPSPPGRSLVVVGFPDVATAADLVPRIMEFQPIGLEGMDHTLVRDLAHKGLYSEQSHVLPRGAGWLLVEFGGENRDDAARKATRFADWAAGHDSVTGVKHFDDPAQQHAIWRVRESGLGATARIPDGPDTWEGWEDSSVPPERLGDYLRELRKLYGRFGYRGSFYGHFGQGCVHTRINFDLTSAPGIRTFRNFLEAAADLVVSMGGSLSGEHGDGQSRAELLGKMFGKELVQAFGEFKAIWDPAGKMNPGKVVNPYRLDENLRLGVAYRPPALQTEFQYPGDDHGSFARAVLRCVGVGECRRHGGTTMCPSYMATREENHSTRGRARLLFEMLRGETIREGWRDPHVRESLDLCLSCKGCRHDCPVNVDMATYKAEFLSHYYAGRLRPRHAYAFGLIGRWMRVGGHVPRLANVLTQTPGLRSVAKWVAGIAPERRIPRLAEQSFVHWFRSRPRKTDGTPVLLWPDTFNNYFHPRTAQAAVTVLERAGFRVDLPDASVCCGRPLYDYGMLRTARKWLRLNLEVLRPAIVAGIPVVGLEPSCIAVFRDEMANLLPHDEDAIRLGKQTFLLSEFLARQAPRLDVPRMEQAALVHGHCHHKAVMGFGDEETLLRRMGLDVTVLDSGCCGMAGAFGFERQHYQLSRDIGERVLLPAVREAASETLIVADGFSCREQIAQLTGRHALHLADVLQMAFETGVPNSTQSRQQSPAWPQRIKEKRP